jgi:tRNA A37 methylthiotransferase MiaB
VSFVLEESRVASYWIETLGCPKNHVDSDKLAGRLESQGYTLALSVD